MPIQKLRQQPASALGVVPVSSIVRQPGGKLVDDLVYRLLRGAFLDLLRFRYRWPRQVADLHGERRALLLQPVPQPSRRNAVVPVVALDLREQIVALLSLAQLEPSLELDDARPCVPQIDLPLEAVERFEPLDRVALDGRTDSLPHRAIEIDEDAAPQQPIHILLASAVAACEPLDRRRLVRGVVIDVQVRIGSQPIRDQVDERLERGALSCRGDRSAFDRPEGMKRRLAVRFNPPGLDHAEEIVDAVDLVRAEERVTLDIEEEIAGRRFREHQQAIVRHERSLAISRRWDAFCNHPALALAAHLDLRLCADVRQRLPSGAGDPVGKWSRRLGEPGPRGDIDCVERMPLDAGQVRHQRQIVVRPPLRTALGAPTTDLAVLDGLRFRRYGE